MSWWILLLGCAPEHTALIDEARPEHLFDSPFPSDDLLVDGHMTLPGFAEAPGALGAGVVGGWRTQAEAVNLGFGVNTGAWLRTSAHLDLPDTTEGTPDDAIVWVALDGSEQLPLDVRQVDDPAGDPFWARNTVAVTPTLGHPPRAGVPYVVALMASREVGPPAGWEPPDGVRDALKAAGIRGRPASATVFTPQDATGQLRAMATLADTNLPDFGAVVLREVTTLAYAEGVTPSGEQATVETVTYADGGTRQVFLSYDPGEVFTVDLTDWPMVVYEADLPTLSLQPLDDRPYMSPGLGHLFDVGRHTGWIAFDADGPTTTPRVEPMRITVQVPRSGSARGVVVWDHGTAGDAYNIVHRPSPDDDGRGVATAFADAGWAVVGRDANLYGDRYPLVDDGFTDGSLGFYNIVNLPAFRDNQRQTALDGHVLARWIQTDLADALPDTTIDTTHLRRAGHSLGSVTSNLGLAMAPDLWEDAFLVGTGGVFSHYFLDTGLLSGIDPALIGTLLGLIGAPTPDPVTTPAILGAALGLPEPAWAAIDRQHPVVSLFQSIMDPSDPMAVARDEAVPTWVLIAPGDRQTPDFTAHALAEALPDATVSICEARGTYDPHQCLWREPEGLDALRDWLAR